MKLVHPDIRMQIAFQPGVVTELILEEQNFFAKYFFELYRQIHGEEGQFVLSEDGCILKINNYMDCIINPYDMNVNTKKILTKVHSEIKSEIHDTGLFLEYEELLVNIHQFASHITECIDTPLIYDAITDSGQILKLLNFKIAMDNTTRIVEQLVDYLKILSEYTEVRLLVLANIKSYISCEDMKYLQEICAYLKLSILLLENSEGYQIENSKKYIIDKEGCELYI